MPLLNAARPSAPYSEERQDASEGGAPVPQTPKTTEQRTGAVAHHAPPGSVPSGRSGATSSNAVEDGA